MGNGLTARYVKPLEAVIADGRANPFLLDVGTSSLFKIDPVMRDALDELGRGRGEEQVILALSEQYDKSEVAECMADVNGLKNSGCFHLPPSPATFSPDTYELILSAFHGCTLRCIYCYGDGGNHYAGSPKVMSFDIAKRAIDYLIGEYGRGARRVTVNFTADGEALLNFDLFKQVEQYCRSLEQSTHDGLRIRCGFVTNATLLTDSVIDYLSQSGRDISFSMDGPPAVHDRMRRFPNGKGSYDTVWTNIQRYRDRTGRTLRAAVVLTSLCTDFRGILTHLVEIGFQRISMKPVRAAPTQPYALNRNTLDAFKQGYSELAEFLINEALRGHVIFLQTIANHSDFLGRFLMRLLLCHRLFYRCMAPSSVLAVTANGDIYPCHDFFGIPDMKIGDVFHGVNPSKQRFLRCLRVDRKESCRNCWARYLCGGGCYAAAWLVNGDVSIPDSAKCELIKHLILLSMYMIGRLDAEKPEVLSFLKQTFTNAEYAAAGTRMDSP